MFRGFIFISYKHDDEGFCKSLITLLERHNLMQMFEPKIIEKMTPEQLTQLKIEHVPALLIINKQTNAQQFFEGNNAFKWIDNLIINKRQSMMNNVDNQRKVIQNNNIKENFKEGMLDYCPNEQSGLSEGYAYYHDDENIDKARTKIQIEQIKKFGEYYDINDPRRLQNDNLGAIPLGAKNMKEYKMKESINNVHGDIKKIIGQITLDRDKQDNEIKNCMEQNTLRTVINKISQQ
jgi:hypothetical protein